MLISHHCAFPCRDVVLELLEDKDALKRSDIIEAAKVKGIQVRGS